MIKLTADPQTFCLIGIASNFKLKKKGRIDSFDLATNQGKYCLKIPAKLHKSLDIELHPLMRLEVRGVIDIHPKKQKVKLKIQQITPLSPVVASDRPPAQLAKDTTIPETSHQSIQTEPKRLDSKPKPQSSIKSLQKTKNKILVCKKSNCWKKGGRLAYEKLQKTLNQKDLEEQVSLKTTGCMGRCKKAPNVVVMPDKRKYTNFEPSAVELLIRRHFSEPQLKDLA